jgi:dihydrofolate reductase
MRKLKLFIACSLDGFIARPDGDVDWLFTDGDYGYQEFYDSIDTTLMGNKTYRQVASFGEFPYPGKNNYVFTRQMNLSPTEHVAFITEDIVTFTRKLKLGEGKDIWLIGGGAVINILYQAGLIDQYILAIHPIILGKGIPLFPGPIGEQKLVLQDCRNYPGGLVQVFYEKV